MVVCTCYSTYNVIVRIMCILFIVTFDACIYQVDSEDVIDVNEVIPGYSTTKCKVVPVCTLCCNDRGYREQ